MTSEQLTRRIYSVDFLRGVVMMVMLLDLEGFTVVPVTDGADALAYLRGGGAAKVILLDLMTPHMDGWAFRREQRDDPSIADIPVIVLSACDTDSDGLDAAASFRKPVDLAKLCNIASSLVARVQP